MQPLYRSGLEISEQVARKLRERKENRMKELKRDLLTSKHTRVLVEEEYTYNAPNHFAIEAQEDGKLLCEINFQEGPIRECGVNGIHNEDLLNIVLERLSGFQKSKFRCRENAVAITKIEEALMWLRKRTDGREHRGVEGTSEV